MKNMLMVLCFFLMITAVLTAAPATKTQVNNLTAFTKLYGYVKHFYPSDEAQEMDWDRFAAIGSEKAQKAKNMKQLRRTLEALFLPIVPDLKLYDEDRPEMPQYRTTGMKKAYWQYEGLNNTMEPSVYRSIRANRPHKIAKNQNVPESWAQLQLQLGEKLSIGDSLEISLRIRKAAKDTLISTIYIGCGASSVEDTLSADQWVSMRHTLKLEEGAEYGVWIVAMNFDTFYLDDLRVERLNGDGPSLLYAADFDKGTPLLLPDGMNVNITAADKYIIQNSDVYVERESKKNKVLAMRQSKNDLPYTYGIVDKIFEEEPAWGETVDVELIPGLSACFPSVLPCDAGGTYPKSDPRKLRKLQKSYARIDLDDRSNPANWMAGMIRYWNELSFFYPYFQYDLCDWDKELEINLARLLECKDMEQYKRVLQLLMSQTHDGHAFLSDPANSSKMPGFNVRPLQGKWIVTKVWDNSLDLPTGSEIRTMNDKDLSVQMEEIRPYFGYSNPESTDIWLFNRYFKTYHDTIATFEIRTPEGQEITLTATLQEYEGWQLVAPDAKTVRFPDDIIYVNANLIDESELQELMPELLEAKGIILDLRYYPRIGTTLLRHLLSEPDSLSNSLIKRYLRPHEELPRTNENDLLWALEPAESHISAKVVALTSRFSQSYCEAYLAELQHNKLATIVGNPTAAANGNVIKTPLPGGLTVHWTGLLVTNPDKSRFHGVGIIPDVLVSPTLEDYILGRDPELDAALQILGE
ncbi:MAG: S41 family peptidase [Candidatus Cloacimonetes bacterium]|nr:S41 family peptidase [Candidatus Cloacimonadota bacterium]